MPIFVSVDAVAVSAQHIALINLGEQTVQGSFRVLANIKQLIAACVIEI